MDSADRALISLLRRNGRESIANLAATLGLSRATVRARMEKLHASGVITGYTIRLREDDLAQPVRGITLIRIAGHRTERIVTQLHSITALTAIHATNGRWDLIAEIAAEDLEAFDAALSAMREIDGILESETNLLLATRHRRSG